MVFGIGNLEAYLLVFVRMTGMIALNPLFSRRGVPLIARTGMILATTILLAPTVPVALPQQMDTLLLILLMFQELVVGALCGLIFQLFYYMIFFTGDIMDMQFGLSMARVFDPGTSIQASISGNLLNILFVFYFFATNSHLVLLQAFGASYHLVPVGTVQISGEVQGFLITLCSTVLSMALRLALPFVAAEFVIEVAMGILMKLIPQMHVFVINIQLKILVGIFLLLAFAQPIGDFMDRYMEAMLHSVETLLTLM